jgi:alpha-soluble NSF attachment protein
MEIECNVVTTIGRECSLEYSMSDAKALDLIKKAEKVQTKWFGGSGKYEDACEFYNQAASQYKLLKEWEKAGDCHRKEAELYETKLKNTLDCSEAYFNAAKAYKNCNGKQAVKMFRVVATMHTDGNRFMAAAKIYKQIATLEAEEFDFKTAVSDWQKAADYYEASDSPVHMNACLLAAADLIAAEVEDYKAAGELYEKISENATGGGEWSVSSHLYKATLCNWIQDLGKGNLENTTFKFEQYQQHYPKFEESKEKRFLEQCLDAWGKDNSDEFTLCVFNYNKRYSQLDSFSTKVFTKIKAALKDGVDAVEEGKDADAGSGDEFR